jgi:hypothetical protein
VPSQYKHHHIKKYQNASEVFSVKYESGIISGEIYDAVGEQMSDSVDTNADMYDDGQEGDIYEAEPVADIPPPVELICLNLIS